MVRKLLLIFLALLLICPSVEAAKKGIYTTVASGTVTQANMRLSGVDGGATASGGAFVDFGAANVLTTKIGHLLRIKDSAGKQIQGFIKAAGTGETTGGDLLAGWDLTSGWTTSSATIDDSNTFTQTSAGGQIYQNILTAKALYKANFDADVAALCQGASSNPIYALDGESNKYKTAVNTTFSIYKSGTQSITVNSMSIYQVLTPSTTGVTIVSTKSGVTYNWFNKNSAFNWNDASGYTYEIVKVNNTVAVVDSSTTAANEHVSLVDGNAFYFGSIDMTPYLDGRHYVRFQDSSGYVAFAKIKAEVPGGEALGSDSARTFVAEVGTPTINGSEITFSNAVEGVIDSNYWTVGSLYSVDWAITSYAGSGNFYLYGGGVVTSGITKSANGNYASYITTNSTNLRVASALGCSGVATINSVKQVIECAATGAHLMNAAGTRNMIYQHPSFNGNAIANIKVLYYGD